MIIPYARPLLAHIVALIDLSGDSRNLRIAPWSSRAIRRGEIHELIATVDAVSDGGSVDRVDYLAFVEFSQGGVLFVGDQMYWRRMPVGTLLGFDETHAPNHLNVVLRTAARETGAQRGWQINDPIEFKHPTEDSLP